MTSVQIVTVLLFGLPILAAYILIVALLLGIDSL